MSKKFRDENTDMLMQAFMSADNLEECYAFFEDLCSEKEIKTMSQRLHIARLLKDNQVYSDIVRKTEAASATISSVSESLKKGKGGYIRAIERIEQR